MALLFLSDKRVQSYVPFRNLFRNFIELYLQNESYDKEEELSECHYKVILQPYGDCVLGEIRVIHVHHLLWRAVLLITHLFRAWLLFS